MNRNFPRDWHEQAATDNENPGEFAESESETRALMKIAEEFNPTSFIDCHTGSWGLKKNLANKFFGYAARCENFIFFLYRPQKANILDQNDVKIHNSSTKILILY